MSNITKQRTSKREKSYNNESIRHLFEALEALAVETRREGPAAQEAAEGRARERRRHDLMA